MKRWKMKGQPASHGQSLTHRKMGATGGGQVGGIHATWKCSLFFLSCFLFFTLQTSNSVTFWAIRSLELLNVGKCMLLVEILWMNCNHVSRRLWKVTWNWVISLSAASTAFQDPGRIWPGKKMPGHMGGNNCTLFALKVSGATNYGFGINPGFWTC